MSWGDTLGSALDAATDKARNAYKNLKDNADAVLDSASATGKDLRDYATEKVKNLKDRAKKYGDTVRGYYDSARNEFKRLKAAAIVAACPYLLSAEDVLYKDVAARLTSWYGEVKRGVAAEKVKVDFNDDNFRRWTGGLSIEDSRAMYEEATGKKISRETIETLFTDPLKAKDLLVSDSDLHRTYRDILNQNLPSSIEQATASGEWVELSKGKSVFHGSLTRGNRKFVSKDGYREIIFSPDGSIDRRQVFKGTFNFFSPNDYPDSHIAADVDPYVVHGN